MFPQGVYRGRALGLFRWANVAWRGKVFRRLIVVNRFPFGLELIRGRLELDADGETVLIKYRTLTDRLMPDGRGNYAGTMRLGPLTVRFELEPEL
jgi:hypothetical protein